MKRIDLGELEDQPWWPRWARDAMTGFLQEVMAFSGQYRVCAPRIAALLRETGEDRVVDLASGGGGPWPWLLPLVRQEGVLARVTLTDLYPNRAAAEALERVEGLRYHPAPVSATAVPPALPGLRTMFTGLHHFDREGVEAILRSARDARVPFTAFEATSRSIAGILATLPVPLLVLGLMPRVRPRRALPLLLTYLPPVLPLAIWWDGFASTLRTWSAAELREITSAVATPDYGWEVEEIRVPRAPVPVTAVLGRPVRAEEARGAISRTWPSSAAGTT